MKVDASHGDVDRRVEAEAIVALTVARITLRIVGFRRLVQTLGRGGNQRLLDEDVLKRIGRAVDRTAMQRGYNCLPRAFAAAWMLRVRGFAPVVHYGVRRKGGEMQAHVWLEVQGVPVVGHEQAPGFALLASFPPSGSAG